MRRFLVLYHSLLTVSLRSRATLFWNFAFPIGLILLYGSIYGGVQFGAFSAITWLTIGVVVLNVMSSGFVGDSAWFARLREQGVLQRIHAAPVPPVILVGAYLLVRLTLILAQSAAIVLVAVLVYGAQFTWAGLGAALALGVLGTSVFVALGQSIAAVSSSSGVSQAIGQALYFPLMFVSNLFVPVETLPAWLANLARWNPAYMLVDLVRPTLVPVPAYQPAWMNLIGLLMYGLLGMIIVARFFRWEPKR